jgi:hypothetical protein
MKQRRRREVRQDTFGQPITILRLGFAAGKTQLLAQGYVACPNPKYFQKETEIIHYNQQLGYWIQDQT